MKSPLPTPILRELQRSPPTVFLFLSISNLEKQAYACLQSIILTSLAVVMAVVPQIARLHFDEHLIPELGSMGFRGRWGDLFHWYKDSAVAVCASVATVAALISTIIRPRHQGKGIYLLFIGLSTVILVSWQLSAFTALAWRGAPGTYEGVMVQLGYVALAASATALDLTPVRITVLLGALGVGLVGVAGWGLPEVFGVHPLLFPWAQQYLLGIDPEQGASLTRSTHSYATAMLSHSNYMGTYSGMVGLVFLTYSLLEPRKKRRVIGLTLAAVALLLLVASFCRAAYGSAVVSLAGLVPLLLFCGLISARKIGQILLIGTVMICSLGILLKRWEPRLGTQLGQRVSSLWVQEPAPKPQPSAIVQAQDQIHLTLEGQFISITAPKAMDFGIAMADGQPLTPGYGGYELVQGLVESSPALFVKRGALRVTVVATPLGLRILGRGALLRPQNPALTALPFGDDFANRRGFIWKRTLPLILAAPWLGYGPGTFMLHYPNRDFTGFLNTFGSTGVLIDKPHNFYLQYAFHFGLLGLGLYIAVALYVVGMCLRELRTERFSPKKGGEGFLSFKLACLMGLICFWGCGFTNDSMSGVTSIAWILMGLLLAGVPKSSESFG